MSRTPAKITQADVARAIRAAQQCGAGQIRILQDGTIAIDPLPMKQIEPAEIELAEGRRFVL